MPRLTRVHQKVFASNASNNGVFGSLQAGNPQTSNDVATLQSLSAFENGWDDAIEQGDKLPPLEEFQGIQYGLSYQQAYMLQEGIPEWNTNTTYYKGSITKVINGTSFKIFSSLTNNNTGNATTNTTHWKLVYDSDIGYADTNFSNLLAPAKNIANWSNNISNCIAEIPQDIKLELNNGTLTLKAGSKVYCPNGSGVFGSVTIQNDLTYTDSNNGKKLVLTNIAGTTLNASYENICTSGTTPPTGTGVFYNTSDNTIFYYSGGVKGGNRAFPIAVITVSNGAISSIDQVFNGFGYIGSSYYYTPNVKVLIPNGRNTDGTLKNIEYTTTDIRVGTVGGTGTFDNYKLRISDNGSINITNMYYDEEKNICVHSNGSILNSVICGSFSALSTVISNFKIKTPFHAVDYYDVALKNGNNTFTGSNTFSGSVYLGSSATSTTPSSATDSSTRVATTAWVNTWVNTNNVAALSTWKKEQNGYYKFKNGLIIQWGKYSGASGTVTFETPFTSGTSYGVSTSYVGTERVDNVYGLVSALTSTGFDVVTFKSTSVCYWIAIGY